MQQMVWLAETRAHAIPDDKSRKAFRLFYSFAPVYLRPGSFSLRFYTSICIPLFTAAAQRQAVSSGLAVVFQPLNMDMITSIISATFAALAFYDLNL
jgi:hypothetical protein